mgnify:CR=1 FL=1
MTQRVTEIDLIRTVAIILMIIYHTAFDLWAFYDWNIDLWGEAWQTFRIITASLFLIVSGIATNFSSKPFRRALIVLACAMLITIVTYVYDPSTFIYFGILHCIGIGMLILIPLKQLKEFNILLGLTIVSFQIFNFSTFQIFTRPTLDFYPLLPWLGLMMIGSGLGHYLYIRNDLQLITPQASMPALQYFVFPGKYALLIYMVHQPIILGILALLYSI